MSLHRLTAITIGVPDVEAVAAFYRAFGLVETAPATLATTDGGDQLHLVTADPRRLVELGLGVDDPADLDALAERLTTAGVPFERRLDDLSVVDVPTGTTIRVTVAPRIAMAPAAAAAVNRPGAVGRRTARADAVDRVGPVRPRKLSHVVVGSPDQASTQRLLVDGLGLQVSDTIAGVGSFLRCSTDHHNVLVQAAPIAFLHHTAWLVDDADEVGRGGAAMVAADPACHVWGLGRHALGSNVFWYLKDPAGTFAEYAADLDVIDDPEGWEPEETTGMRALMAWGPPVPGPFLLPDDVAERLGAAGTP